MQSLSWYARRLGAMSPGELWWRLGGKARDAVDRCLVSARRRPVSLRRIAEANGRQLAVRHEAIGSAGVDGWTLAGGSTTSWLAEWRERIVPLADALIRNRLPLFDIQTRDLGQGIDWNREYKAGKRAPMCHASAIDYRDHAVTGDCKFVWEPNRHQHLVVLGRAYRLTGEQRYARTVLEHIGSWIEQCPFGMGMNWRSPLELAIRLINWAWALELIRPSGLVDGERMRGLLPVVYRHLWSIARNYSRYSSANNHLIGEAAGVLVASSYFESLRESRRWRDEASKILVREIAAQTHEDGGTREQAMGYHLFVLEFFVLAGLAAERVGVALPRSYWDRLERMFEFLAAFVEGGERLWMFGDADDGYVLDLGGREDAARSWLSVGAALFGRDDFKELSGGLSEAVFWLLGETGCGVFERLADSSVKASLASRALPHSGYYLLQAGRRGGPEAISVGFDCGELGFGALAAHGHADALSVTLRVGGSDILVDPGTYDYFTYPEWRCYFRGTRAHNTVVIDEQDQSEMLGPFLWGQRANCRCVQWSPNQQGGTVVGEHDGYGRLPGGVRHRRTVTLDAGAGQVCVTDFLTGGREHSAGLYWHLSDDCQVRRVSEHVFEVHGGGCVVVIELDERLSVRVLCGSQEPKGGWVSRGYHRKWPATTLLGCCQWREQLTLASRIRVE